MTNRQLISTDEQELISKCLENNKIAQQQMYDLLKGRMFAVCVRYVGDVECAKDVFHDGFITLFSKLNTYKGDGSFEGWARRIFVTTSLMHLRKTDVLKRAEQIEDFNSVLQSDVSVVEKMETVSDVLSYLEPKIKEREEKIAGMKKLIATDENEKYDKIPSMG